MERAVPAPRTRCVLYRECCVHPDPPRRRPRGAARAGRDGVLPTALREPRPAAPAAGDSSLSPPPHALPGVPRYPVLKVPARRIPASAQKRTLSDCGELVNRKFNVNSSSQLRYPTGRCPVLRRSRSKALCLARRKKYYRIRRPHRARNFPFAKNILHRTRKRFI